MIAGEFWGRLQGAIEEHESRGGGENVPSNSARGAQEEVSARGADFEAVRSSEYRKTDRDMCSEAADYDRDGTSSR